MLERCPYYERCSPETRQIRGSSEHFCLGSLNWEFCPQFQDYSRSGETFLGFGRDEEIKQLGRTISKNLQNKIRSSLVNSLVTSKGEVLYRDRQWSEQDLLFIQNTIRYKSGEMELGEFLKVQNNENILIIKVHQHILLICKVRVQLDELLEFIIENLSNLQADLESYLTENPISLETEGPEQNIILTLLKDLQKKLEAINVTTVIQDLNKIQEKISEFFSWTRMLYEISMLIEQLEQYPSKNELKERERKEILKKIKEWQEKIREVS